VVSGQQAADRPARPEPFDRLRAGSIEGPPTAGDGDPATRRRPEGRLASGEQPPVSRLDLPLSRLLRFQLVDRKGWRARLVDLGVSLEQDYPAVSAIFCAPTQGGTAELPWSAVRGIEGDARLLRVEDLQAAQRVEDMDTMRVVLLARHVQDAQVLDLRHRQAMRPNDLWLRQVDDRLLLVAADLSPWAVLRRVSGGHLDPGRPELVDWKDVEFLIGDPRATNRGRGYVCRVAELHPPEIAELAESVPYLHAAELVGLLPEGLAADVLEAMRLERQVQVLEELKPERAVRLLELMAPDLAADLLGELEPDVARALLERLPAPRREQLAELLRYPHNTAGGIMTNDVVVAPAGMRVQEARRILADRLKAPDFVYYVYLVDDEDRRRLQGVLTLRDLLVAEEHASLQEVMQPRMVVAYPREPAQAAARRLADHQLAAVPVVDEGGRLLGAITFDAAMAELTSMPRDEMPRIFS
jgi:CBS domain-containing protein